MEKDSELTSDMDALEILEADHTRVKKWFKQFEELGDRAYAGKKELANKICDALGSHTRMEEELFYPAVRAKVDDAGDLVDEADVEHASAKDLIVQIEAMDPENELYDAKVKVLGEQIDHHVGEEENEMFPKVRKSDLDIKAIGREMLEWKKRDKKPE